MCDYIVLLSRFLLYRCDISILFLREGVILRWSKCLRICIGGVEILVRVGWVFIEIFVFGVFDIYLVDYNIKSCDFDR